MTKALASLVASLAFVAFAYAGEMEGTVQSVDPAARTITLDDGTSFTAAEGINLEALIAGAQVKVIYEDGTNTATAVEAM